jgi:SOS response regulatory protein OraA/RecX
MDKRIVVLIVAALAIVVIAAAAMSGGGSDNKKDPEAIHATDIMIDKTTLSLNEGDSYSLKATIVPEGCTDPVVWSSSNPSVCSVSDGKVIGIKAGSATITAQCGTEKTSCFVEVKAIVIPATEISIDKTTLCLYPNGSSTITATVTPNGSTDKVVWTSSDASICTVSNGKVIAIKDGSCTITATAGKESVTCEVTVYKPASAGELNALSKAQSYLSYTSFSEKGLYEQLLFEKFSESEAKYAVNNCGADWYEQASKKALSYLSHSSFSKTGLIEQLIFEDFTEDQAQKAVESCGADWYEQAVLKAKSYLSHSSFSKEDLYEQLLFEGFTEDQAQKAVDQLYV